MEKKVQDDKIYFIVYGGIGKTTEQTDSSPTLTSWSKALDWFDKFEYCEWVYINRIIPGKPDMIVKKRGIE